MDPHLSQLPCRKRALFQQIYLGLTGPFSTNLPCIQHERIGGDGAPSCAHVQFAASGDVEERPARSFATWNADPEFPIIEVFHVARKCGMILAWNTATVARRRP
jgi:hypothetical protein